MRSGKSAGGKTTNNVGHLTNNIGRSSFASLFASDTLVRLLKQFVLNSDHDYYQRQLSRITGAKLYTVQRELSRLLKTGLITKYDQGNRVYYKANRNHPAFEDLKRMLLKTTALGDILRESLQSMANKIRLAFIYGSFARGEETDESDVDVLIVGEITSKETADKLGSIGRNLNREFNPTTYSTAEFLKKAREGHVFIKEILASPKIWLIGNDEAIADIVE